MGKYGNSDGDLDATVNTTLSKPKDPKMQAAKVQMPIGTSKDFELHRGSDGDALFNLVSADLSIEERDYFSLCFYDNEGIRHWLYNDKKILRQLKGSISNLPVYLSFLGLPWEFSYEVKFYPTEPTTLSDDNARYNLFLQLRKDVASGRLPATIPTHALLGALVAQAEYGDADCSADYEQQLKGSLKIPNSNDPSQLMQLLDRVKEIHREHKGLTASDAQSKYLDACKQLSMYGVFVFDAKDKDDSNVGIGICATGVNIYKETIRVHRFVWQNIVKISYRKNTFSVKIKEGEHNKKEITLTYKVHDYISAKRVWKCGVEHHTFFRLIQPEIKPKGGLFRWGSTRFRYSGRTQFQTKMASQMFNNSQGGTVPRSTNARLTQSFDHGLNKENDPVLEKTFGRDGEPSSPGVSYDIASSKKAGSTNGKGKKIKGEHGKDSSDSSSSDEESGFKVVESTIVEQICELQTPHPDVNTSPSRGGPESLGEFVSSKIVTSGNRTIETITYKAERGGEVETYVEHRVTINSDVPIDHDAELNAAILEATKLNPEFSVERIEVRQEAST